MVYGLLREVRRRKNHREPLADGTHCLEYYGVDYVMASGASGSVSCYFETHAPTKTKGHNGSWHAAPADRPLPRVRATLDPLPYDRDDDAFPDP